MPIRNYISQKKRYEISWIDYTDSEDIGIGVSREIVLASYLS